MVQQQVLTQFRTTGRVLLRRGLLTSARDEFSRWLEVARAAGDAAEMVPPLNALATVALERRDYAGALAYLDQAVPHLQVSRVAVADALKCRLNLVVAYVQTGNLDAALENAREAYCLSSSLESPDFQALAWLDLSWVYLKRQEWAQAQSAARRAMRLFSRLGDPVHIARSLGNLGLAHLEVGATELALRDLSRALALHQRMGRGGSAYNHTDLGRLCFQEGRTADALAHARNAMSIMLSDFAVLDKSEAAAVSELFGAIFATAGKKNLALKYLNRAAAYFSQLGMITEWSRATAHIGQLLTAGSPAQHLDLREDEGQLRFLTAVLDLTDDIESVDPHLRGHSERVTHYSLIIGRDLPLSGALMAALNNASRLHDVGFVAVDAEILQKRGPLTEAERERVQVHSVIGEEMLRPYGLGRDALLGVRHHHEWWDGSGYPDGLSGESIPLIARIIHLVDVYDALTCARSFREALVHTEALALLRSLAGKQLDPNLVARFVQLHTV